MSVSAEAINMEDCNRYFVDQIEQCKSDEAKIAYAKFLESSNTAAFENIIMRKDNK